MKREKEMDEKIICKIDAVISKVSENIAEGEILPDYLADTVKALAVLLEARANLPS